MPSLWPKMIAPDYSDPTEADNQPDIDEEAEQDDSSTPQSTQQNIGDVRQNLRGYLANQVTGQNALQQFANKYGKQIDAQNAGQVNLSPLMQLMDQHYGTTMAKNYKAPLTPDEITQQKLQLQAGVNKAGDPVAAELLKEYGQDNTAQNQLNRALASKINHENSQEKALDELERKFALKMNPMDSAYGTGLGNLGQRMSRARNALRLIQQHPNLKFTEPEAKDFALSLATMLSGQNRVPIELVNGLSVPNFGAELGKFISYFTGDPKDQEDMQNREEFIRRSADTINREKDLTQSQIEAIQDQLAQGYYPLALKRPDRFKAIKMSGGGFLKIPSADELPPEAKIPGATTAAATSAPQTKVMHGHTYQKVPGGWKKVK